ncbi:glycosyltransferase [bacterium]|nr:glycosyltransferase [bacterium]
MKQPLFSIIIPTYNRPEQLAQCLKSLTLLNYPVDRFEVIVIDDGSLVSPKETVAAVKHRVDIQLITQPNAGPAAARNAGAVLARGKFLAFTDDDCRPHTDWLKTLTSRFTERPEIGIGGCVINALGDNFYSTASHVLIDYLYGYFNKDPENATLLTSNNLVLPEKQFREMGGFDTTFPLAAAEDREFCYRWVALGHPLVYAEETRIDHAHHLTMRSFWRQHYNYGRGAYHFHQIRAEQELCRIKTEPISFYYKLIRYGFKSNHGSIKIFITALLLLSQAANAMGFVYSAIKGRR